MSKEGRRSELKRFESKQRHRDFLLGSIEAAQVTRDLLVEFVNFFARRTLGLVSPLLLVALILVGITGFLGWVIFLLTSLFHHF
jgi:hypothetical protein